MRQFTYNEMFELLKDGALKEEYLATGWLAPQALHCPYYVPLAGHLGADWGVIVNPESRRFRMLTFEHDDCGCPGDDDRHRNDPEQDGDTWWTGWTRGDGGPRDRPPRP